MSVRRAMKQATLEIVKAEMGWSDGSIAITRRGGKPRPDCGDWFLAIWGGPRTSGLKTAQDVRLSINLTLTRRFDGPYDREDSALDAEEEGFDEKMDQLYSVLYSKQFTILSRADELMPEGYSGFVTAPMPMQDGEPEECSPMWFGGVQAHSRREGSRGQFVGGDSQIYGFKATMVYGNWSFIHPVLTGKL